uniref:Uncharacterized protein n=2 Tax=Sus scrofa TaxID=9823 RepID=A0A5G2R8Z8_PIG
MGYKNALNYTKQDKTTEPRWELRLGYPDGEQVRKTRTEWKSLRDRALPPKANETELASLRKNKPSKLKAKYSHVAVNLLRFTVSSEQPAQNSHPPHPSYLLRHSSIGSTLPKGKNALTDAHMPALPAGQGVFPASSPGMDSHRLPDDQPIFDQLPDLLTWETTINFPPTDPYTVLLGCQSLVAHATF